MHPNASGFRLILFAVARKAGTSGNSLAQLRPPSPSSTTYPSSSSSSSTTTSVAQPLVSVSPANPLGAGVSLDPGRLSSARPAVVITAVVVVVVVASSRDGGGGGCVSTGHPPSIVGAAGAWSGSGDCSGPSSSSDESRQPPPRSISSSCGSASASTLTAAAALPAPAVRFEGAPERWRARNQHPDCGRRERGARQEQAVPDAQPRFHQARHHLLLRHVHTVTPRFSSLGGERTAAQPTCSATAVATASTVTSDGGNATIACCRVRLSSFVCVAMMAAGYSTPTRVFSLSLSVLLLLLPSSL
ncbi:uncharacterized protein LOC116950319 [Petromyzon marinus]|uniref:Uncharacterized protein n=1 Tax=Petromyzon marinus TaxID=7757 RepID=A0AAJ7TUR1_PETMA|nr:putative protein TPRXL [Petromyzon marinus]